MDQETLKVLAGGRDFIVGVSTIGFIVYIVIHIIRLSRREYASLLDEKSETIEAQREHILYLEAQNKHLTESFTSKISDLEAKLAELSLLHEANRESILDLRLALKAVIEQYKITDEKILRLVNHD